MSPSSRFRDNVVAFTALPGSVRLVLLLVFLNSFRSFGLRFVQQLYLTNEFGFSDLETASILGTAASLHVFFGLAGAVLTDAIGVRRVALAALSIAVVGRGLLAFGRSRVAIYAAFYLFSPAGEALLATGLYRVALKKLTTPGGRAGQAGDAAATRSRKRVAAPQRLRKAGSGSRRRRRYAKQEAGRGAAAATRSRKRVMAAATRSQKGVTAPPRPREAAREARRDRPQAENARVRVRRRAPSRRGYFADGSRRRRGCV